MTSDNLLKFLGNREYLHQVSYQELKSMVVEYPYSVSLRYLLAMKSKQEDNTDLDRNIELLSTYGIDRSHLHRIFSEDPIVLEDLEESIIMGEDFLELKELSALERDLEEELLVNEVNNLNFLQDKQAPIAQEIPISQPDIELAPTPIIDTEITDIGEEIALEPTTPSLEEVAPIIAAAALVTSNLNTETVEPVEEELEQIEVPVEAAIPILSESTLVTDIDKELTEIPPIIADAPIPIEENDNQPIEESIDSIEKEEEEEEFITLGFEDELPVEASGSGIATVENEAAPSASLATNEIVEEIEADGGLPQDAVEVNDLYALENKPVLDKDLVESLFEEAEAEAVAEPAISDSASFMENPATVLITESEAIEEITTTVEETSNLVESEEETATDNIVLAEVSQKIAIPSVDFEIEYSETDPVTFESIQEGTDTIPPEELEETEEVAVSVDTQEIAVPANKVATTVEDISIPQSAAIVETIHQEMPVVSETPPVEVKEQEPTIEIPTIEKIPAVSVPATFKFSSLDRLAATFNQTAIATKPAPKAKFTSWQEQYAEVGPFSGIHLMPVLNGKGKIIKRKRKVIHKEFEKTVAFAEESLAFDTALVSETLAQLLVRQGRYSKAKTMYEQLCLIMPKKSSFFAGEIEKIQNLPDEDS